jgi:hypothetical protein
VSRAGGWFLRSGIQETNGGVARYCHIDRQQNLAVSTEITGYTVSALVYLHSLTGDSEYLDRATAAAQFLVRKAWDRESQTMPFEVDPPALTYFFDCGIIVRGLLSVWRATESEEYLEVAAALGQSMATDFAGQGDYHPILELPDKKPLERDALSWSRSPGCYQLKAAMAWWDLWETAGERRFQDLYDSFLADSLRTFAGFLPGHPDRLKVMDRLHAFLYFLEGLLPRAAEERCAAAMRTGIAMVERLLREIAPDFERSDVYAQLLRIRLYADWAGAVPLDRGAAGFEVSRLAGFQSSGEDPRLDGGFCFGRKNGQCLPHMNPVSTAFALQALALWDAHRSGEAQPHRHLLI